MNSKIFRPEAVSPQGPGLIASDVNKTKFLRPRPRPPEVNKGTSQM